MRNNLIILNYQREIPPFMQNIIHYADGIYDKIFYLTPELRNDNRDGCNSKKLEVIQISRKQLRRQLLKLPYSVMNKATLEQLRVAVKNSYSIGSVLKRLLGYDLTANFFVTEIEKMLSCKKIDAENTVVLSTWFAVEALAGARIKKKYPDIRFVSLAHSFEIDVNKSPLMAFSYNTIKHRYCDHIYFISSEMRKQYYRDLKKLFSIDDEQNTSISYLGSRKYFPNRMTPRSTDGLLRVVSCSGVTPVKRVDMIIDALSMWEGTKLEWTHIGAGPLLDQMVEYAREKLESKRNVEYRFVGHMENAGVHQYYNTNAIDLFLNVSDAEGLPVSLMECMSYGIPAIATDVGGSREIVTSKTGFLLNRNFEAEELCDLLYSYSELSFEKQQEYRKAAFELWKNRFNGSDNAINFLREIQDERVEEK